MALSPTLRTYLQDILAGVVAFVLFYVGIRWVPDNHAAFLFLTAEATYFAVTLWAVPRERPSPLLRVLVITAPGLGTILTFAYTGYAFTSPLYVGVFSAAAFLGVALSLLFRRMVAIKNRPAALLIVIFLFVLTFLSVKTFIPRTVAASLGQNTDRRGLSFSFTGLDGTLVRSDALHGKVVLLAFWATWCRPCVGELPHIEEVYQQYRNNPEVVIWVVDSGISNDSVDKQRRMIRTFGWDLPFAYDTENLEYRMGLHGLPKLVLLDKAGHIRWLHDGFDGSEDLAAQVTNKIGNLLSSH